MWHIDVTIPSDEEAIASILVGLVRGDRRTKIAEPLAAEVIFQADPKGEDRILSPREVNEAGHADCSSLVRAAAAYQGTHIGVCPAPGGYHAFLVDASRPGSVAERAERRAREIRHDIQARDFQDKPLRGQDIRADMVKDVCVQRGMNGGKSLPLSLYQQGRFAPIWPPGEKSLGLDASAKQKAESHYKTGAPATRGGAIVQKIADVVSRTRPGSGPPATAEQYKTELQKLRTEIRSRNAGRPSEVDQAASALEAALSIAQSPGGTATLSDLLAKAAQSPQDEALARILQAVREISDRMPGVIPPNLIQQAGGMFPPGYGYEEQAAPPGYAWAQDPMGNLVLVPAGAGAFQGDAPPGWTWGVDAWGNPELVPSAPSYPGYGGGYPLAAAPPPLLSPGYVDSLFSPTEAAVGQGDDIDMMLARVAGCPGGTGGNCAI